jgi:hypothetical protein
MREAKRKKQMARGRKHADAHGANTARAGEETREDQKWPLKTRFHFASTTPVEVAALNFVNESGLVCLALGERGLKVWPRELEAEFPSSGPIAAVTVMLTPGAGGEVHYSLDKALEWLDRLERVCANSDNGLIHVAAAGGGPTDKSRKVRMLARANPKRGKPQQQAPAVEHTLTVAASLVEEHNGKLWMPRWSARRTANERLSQPKRQEVRYEVEGLGGQCMVPADVQAGIEALREALRDGLEKALPLARKVQGEALAQRAAERAAWEAEAPARAERAREAAAVDAERARAAAQTAEKAKANREQLPTVTGARVAWVDYVGTSRNKKAVLREADGCTVRASGERIYITLVSGVELIKTRATVQVNDQELPVQHSVRRARERQAAEAPGLN